MSLDDLSLADIRRELQRLTAIASSAERPKPTRINGPNHPMPGHEWDLREQPHPHTHRDFMWIVRTVDEQHTADGLVYVSTPESMYPGEDFTPLYASDARRLAMTLLAAADRADHQAFDIPRLEDRRRPPQPNPGPTSDRRTECANCGREIENRAEPVVFGPGRDYWVHMYGSYTPCYPQRGADSPRAEPRSATRPEEQQ